MGKNRGDPEKVDVADAGTRVSCSSMSWLRGAYCIVTYMHMYFIHNPNHTATSWFHMTQTPFVLYSARSTQ